MKNNLFKYIMISLMCAIIDNGLFSIIILILKHNNIINQIYISIFIARTFSSLINYILNKNIVFKYKKNKIIERKSLKKYITLVVLQMFISSIIINTIYNLTLINEIIVKMNVEIIIFICNYIIQKKIVFKKQLKTVI